MNAKEKTKKHFDDAAAGYDLNKKFDYPRFHYNILLKEINKHQPINNFLDAGCGTGALLENICNNNTQTFCYGIDLSENMIIQAKERLKSRVNLIAGDVENMPYESNLFDCICCSSSFHHYPNPIKSLKEIHRVLKKGGVFILCDNYIIFPLRQIANIIIPRLNRGDVHIYGEREIKKLFCNSGFNKIEWQKIPRYAFICIGYK